MKKFLFTSLIVILVLGIVGTVALTIYSGSYSKPNEKAVQAMISTSEVSVLDTRKEIVYKPNGLPEDQVLAGIVFYPGGKVDPSVYSRIFVELAKNGVQTVVVKMPFNLAMFNMNGADRALKEYPAIKNWYIGGHSLGGVFASSYGNKHLTQFQGIFFWASYPTANLSLLTMPILSLYGTKDSVLESGKIDDSRKFLPENANVIPIEGGNHTQFGDYDLQKGDAAADITPEEQQTQVVDLMLEFMGIIGGYRLN